MWSIFFLFYFQIFYQFEVNPNHTSIQQLPFSTSITAIMLRDKPHQQTRQRKNSNKFCSKEKTPVGTNNAQLSGTTDSPDGLLLPPLAKKPPELKRKVSVVKVEEESSLAVCLQVLFPYLLAGMGMVMAGMVLHYVQVSALKLTSNL